MLEICGNYLDSIPSWTLIGLFAKSMIHVECESCTHPCTEPNYYMTWHLIDRPEPQKDGWWFDAVNLGPSLLSFFFIK